MCLTNYILSFFKVSLTVTEILTCDIKFSNFVVHKFVYIPTLSNKHIPKQRTDIEIVKTNTRVLTYSRCMNISAGKFFSNNRNTEVIQFK